LTCNSDYPKEKLIEKSLNNFPSEKKNLQKLLSQNSDSAQSRAKCTGRISERKDESPFGSHLFRKDDGFVHPNKKY